jgi:hypothetical protein
MPMTVGEARALLSQYPDELPLMREYDSCVLDDLMFCLMTIVPDDEVFRGAYCEVPTPTADSWTVLVAC